MDMNIAGSETRRITVNRRLLRVEVEDSSGKVTVRGMLRRDINPYERFLARAGWSCMFGHHCETVWTRKQ